MRGATSSSGYLQVELGQLQLSSACSNLAATSDGDLALFGGGLNNENATSSRVDSYHSTTGTWSTATLSAAVDLPTTPHLLFLCGDLFALEILQFASGFFPVGHSFQVSAFSTILLPVPTFQLLYNDPLIGLAKLLGQKGRDSSNDEFLIIGVVVGGSATLLLVF